MSCLEENKIFRDEFLDASDNGWPRNCYPMTTGEVREYHLELNNKLIKEDKKFKDSIKSKNVDASVCRFSQVFNLGLFSENDFGQLMAIENFSDIQYEHKDNPAIFNIHIWKEMNEEKYNIIIPDRPCGPEDIEQNRDFGLWLYDLCAENGKNIWYGNYQVNSLEAVNKVLEKVHSSIAGQKYGFLYRVVLKKTDFEKFTDTLSKIPEIDEAVIKILREHDLSLFMDSYFFNNGQYISIKERGNDFVCVNFTEELQ